MQQAQMNIKKVGRNDPCQCGSGKKYKHCCQAQTDVRVTRPPAVDVSVPGLLRAAMEHHQAGRLPQAEALYRQILQAAPNNPDALHLLGLIAHQAGKIEIAVDLISRAIRINPSGPMYYNLGVALQARGEMDAAVESYRKALALMPDYAEAHSNLGTALQAQGKYDAAAEHLRQALLLRPKDAGAHSNLGVVQQAQGHLDAALESFHRALAIKPDYAEAHNNLGMTQQAQGHLDAALESFHRALAIKPDYAEAHNNLSLMLLLRGALHEGWREYEWRVQYRSGHAYLVDPRDPTQVLLRPSAQLPVELDGKRILLVPEQGIGDELFFLRFARLARQRGAWLAYQPSEKIVTLVQRAPGLDAILHGDDSPANLDQILLVGDLPLILGADRLDDLPPALPLTVLPKRRSTIKNRLAALGYGPVLGVTWRAGTERNASQGKSLLFKETDVSLLGRTLSAWPGEVLILQRHPRAEDIECFQGALGRSAHDWSDLNENLEDMLALLSQLDEYVGVSNTNMHLMAGLGKTARVLVPNPPEWRWMREGDESPWFPGFKLYRQQQDGEWSGALARLTEDLQQRDR
jgi:tetratricopeptide (TPR) repeat protein